MMKTIKLLDTTLRDGDQTPGVNLSFTQKREIAAQLCDLGVDIIEAGFAAASQSDFNAICAAAEVVGNTKLCALARCTEQDIEAAARSLDKAKNPRIHIFIATSPIHMQYKLNMSEQEVLERAVKSAELAKRLCGDVQFSAEDATRSDVGFVCRVFSAVIASGVSTVNFPDTVGYCIPSEYAEMIKRVFTDTAGIKNVVLAAHCHNDLGLAVANSLAAAGAGVTQLEGTINGLGERAGNASLEEIIMAIRVRNNFFGFDTNVNIKEIAKTCRLVSSISGVPIPVGQPIIGKNAFRHESGIHQHGVLSNENTYQIMSPTDIGRTGNRIILGKLSGRHAFESRASQLGFSLDQETLESSFEAFKLVAEKKNTVADDEISEIIREKIDEKLITNGYKLIDFQIQSSGSMKSSAMLTLNKNDASITEAAVGNGPIDAAFNAVNRIVGEAVSLDAYSISAATEGADALGVVSVKILYSGNIFHGRGVSTDIIEASIKSYINAINRALYYTENN
ncbi:MAG: 2-isopropylmalate synthase [Oscillospiraceae bacterium]|nr:2-isopropylmalate synthase [Oscillospiraceae bacterium]